MPADTPRIVVVMMDGFGPEYLQASEMPNLKAMISRGFYKTVQACMPTVTNVNNASICTGTWPPPTASPPTPTSISRPAGALHGSGRDAAGSDALRAGGQSGPPLERSSPPR